MSEIPHCQAIVQDIIADTENLFETLSKVCNDIGFNENARRSYCEQARNHLKALIKEMVEEAEAKREDLYEAVENLLLEVSSLSKELKSDPGLRNFTNVPLVDVQFTLQTQIETLRQIKEQRLNYLEELLKKENDICRAIGAKPMGKSEGVPSNEDLENFKLYLERQETEKNRLESTFKEMRRSIVKMMDELGISPSLEFEHVVCNEPENIVYSANNMQKTREMRDRMKENLDAATETISFQRSELLELWKCLDIPNEWGDKIFTKFSGCSASDIHGLNEEIKRCKQMRSDNIERYVEKIREQLRNLWDMCRFDEAQRSAFKPYYVQIYTENLLTLHDLEVERLRQYYNKNKKIYDLLNEREIMWDKGKELDQRENDPERLHNRGGQLLTEEKERRLIQKKLPKIDEHIRQLIREYEILNNQPFTIDGKSYEEFLAQSHDNYVEAKETLKKARLAKAKDKSFKKTPIMSASRRTPATATSMLRPGFISVRRRDDKSPRVNSTSKRLIHSEKTRPTVLTSRIRHSGRLPRRLVASSRANTSNRSSKKTETTVNDTQNTISSVSHYEQFQRHLKIHEELRSSILPEQALKIGRTKSHTKMRTPVKTPIKPLRKNLSTVVNTPGRTPKSSYVREQSRSPRLMTTPRLAATPTTLPTFF